MNLLPKEVFPSVEFGVILLGGAPILSLSFELMSFVTNK